MQTALFIDRDGVINHDAGYTHRVEDFVLLPGVVETLRWFRERGHAVVVVTNQAGIARGFYGTEQLHAFNAHMTGVLRAGGVDIAGIYHCPHHPEGSVAGYAIACECRKPAPGMLLQAARELDIDLARSWLIGDKPGDVEAGRRAGLPPQQCLQVPGNEGLVALLADLQRR